MQSSKNSPPAFQWDQWYAAIGGRQIKIKKVDDVLADIKEFQYPRFTGPINQNRTKFSSAAEAANVIKVKARELGADEVGIAIIESTDINQGREINEKFAIVVAQRMLWREFQKVADQQSAIECMRI